MSLEFSWISPYKNIRNQLNKVCYFKNSTEYSEAESVTNPYSNFNPLIDYDPTDRVVYKLDNSNKIWIINLDNRKKRVVYELPDSYEFVLLDR